MLKKLKNRYAPKRACATRSAADVARGLLAGRRALQQHLPADLLHDPSLDMLLSLLVAEADGVAMGAAELATTTTVGAAVAARWIKAMQELGLIEHETTVALTPAGRAAVAAALAGVGVALLTPAYARRPRLRMLYRRDQSRAAGCVALKPPTAPDSPPPSCHSRPTTRFEAQ
jgi:hypothetical protein